MALLRSRKRQSSQLHLEDHYIAAWKSVMRQLHGEAPLPNLATQLHLARKPPLGPDLLTKPLFYCLDLDDSSPAGAVVQPRTFSCCFLLLHLLGLVEMKRGQALSRKTPGPLCLSSPHMDTTFLIRPCRKVLWGDVSPINISVGN